MRMCLPCYVCAVRSEIDEAIRLLKSGDPESTEKAIALLQDSVFSFSMRVCNQREDAEDTMQEVLLKSVAVLIQRRSRSAARNPVGCAKRCKRFLLTTASFLCCATWRVCPTTK